LDIGCGRGEWLELLAENGRKATGVEINKVVTKQCQALGLNVIEQDALFFMKTLKDKSLGAITGFHVIEHLSFETLIGLFDESLRVLKPGGVVIFETPNPANINVGAHTFYNDPTHKAPLPSPVIKFIAEQRGFCNIEIIFLHPLPEEYHVGEGDLAIRFNDYFYGPQDYSIIGYKGKN